MSLEISVRRSTHTHKKLRTCKEGGFNTNFISKSGFTAARVNVKELIKRTNTVRTITTVKLRVDWENLSADSEGERERDRETSLSLS